MKKLDIPQKIVKEIRDAITPIIKKYKGKVSANRMGGIIESATKMTLYQIFKKG